MTNIKDFMNDQIKNRVRHNLIGINSTIKTVLRALFIVGMMIASGLIITLMLVPAD